MFEGITNTLKSFIEKVGEFNESIYPNPHDEPSTEAKVKKIAQPALSTDSTRVAASYDAVIQQLKRRFNPSVPSTPCPEFVADDSVIEALKDKYSAVCDRSIAWETISENLKILEDKGIPVQNILNLDDEISKEILQDPHHLINLLDKCEWKMDGFMSISRDFQKYLLENSSLYEGDILLRLRSKMGSQINNLKDEHILQGLRQLKEHEIGMKELNWLSPNTLAKILEEPKRLTALLDKDTTFNHFLELGDDVLILRQSFDAQLSHLDDVDILERMNSLEEYRIGVKDLTGLDSTTLVEILENPKKLTALLDKGMTFKRFSSATKEQSPEYLLQSLTSLEEKGITIESLELLDPKVLMSILKEPEELISLLDNKICTCDQFVLAEPKWQLHALRCHEQLVTTKRNKARVERQNEIAQEKIRAAKEKLANTKAAKKASLMSRISKAFSTRMKSFWVQKPMEEYVSIWSGFNKDGL